MLNLHEDWDHETNMRYIEMFQDESRFPHRFNITLLTDNEMDDFNEFIG